MTDSPVDTEYSVVVPVYETVESVRELVTRLRSVLDTFATTYEIILVDDGSTTPQTWRTLEDLAAAYSEVTAVRLTKNYGKAAAVICGFEHAAGRWVVTMDDDLQHLPEDLPAFVELREHDVVMGAYREKNHPLAKRVTSGIKGWFDRVIAGKPRHLVSNPYRLHKAWVIKAICDMTSPYPFVSAMMYHTTTDIVSVEIEHGVRTGRRSQFTFRRRLKSFSNLLINRSSFVLRVIAIVGIVVGLLAAVVVVVVVIAGGVDSEVSMVALVGAVLIGLNGLMLVATAVIGEYLTRVLVGIERRPAFLVREIVGARRDRAHPH